MTRVLRGWTLLALLASCSSRTTLTPRGEDGGVDLPSAPNAGDSGVAADAGVRRPTYLTHLNDFDDFRSLQGEKSEVKYLTRVTDAEPLVAGMECWFQDTELYPYHLQFLRTEFPTLSDLDFASYVSLVLQRQTRRLWGGVVRHFPRLTHPLSGIPGILVYTVYTNDGSAELLTVEDVTEVNERLRACAPFAASRLVFVPDSTEQTSRTRELHAQLVAAGVAVRYPDELVEKPYEVYSAGESYGFLRPWTGNGNLEEEVGIQDVVVTESAPADLATVAGLLTELPQSMHSHTNLRLREKQLPNAMVQGILKDTRIAELTNQLVHIVVGESGLTLETATRARAEEFWRARRPNVGPVQSDVTATALTRFDQMSHDLAPAYGAKAANLGELYSVLPARNRVWGFGIPLSFYREFAAHNGVDDAVTTLLADSRVGTDRAYRVKKLDDLRDQIRDGNFPPNQLETIVERIHEVFGDEAATTYLRFRSSTNAEDLDQFSGAGLYDSRTGCLADDLDGDDVGPSRCLSETFRAHLEQELERREAELLAYPERTWLLPIIDDLRGDLTEEKPVADAIRKVWRSLWNLRAFDEREFYGIDHRDVYMAIAVAPSFVMERREAVVVTGLAPDDGPPLYRMVSQWGDVGVVRPSDPSAVAETLTFRRDGDTARDVRVVVPSSLTNGAPLWTDEELTELSSRVFTVHDHFSAHVYSHIPNLRLDLEVEVTFDGRIVIKQARPYLGYEP
jgi:pyruvate,water dikinase